MKFQLMAVEYTGLKLTKGASNPKPKALELGGGLQNFSEQNDPKYTWWASFVQG